MYLVAPLRDVLLVILAQVVTEVVAPMERRVATRALGIVTVIGVFALVGSVLVLVMAVEVGVAFERDSFASGDKTAVPVRGLEPGGVSWYSKRGSISFGN